MKDEKLKHSLPSHNEGYEGSDGMKGMNDMNDKQYEELMKCLNEIAKSLNKIANSLFWLLHRAEIDP